MADQAQAIAGLRVMMAVAKADGHFADSEAKQIEEAIEEIGVPRDAVFAEPLELSAELAKIQDADARLATYRAAVLLSMADGEAHPEETKALARVREAFDLKDESSSVASMLAPAAAVPIGDEVSGEQRTKELKRKIQQSSLISAVLGANPIPVVSLFTDMAVYWVQWDVVRHIGHLYGHQMSRKEVAAMFAGTFGLGLARTGVSQLMKVVPVWGSAFGAATAFTTTYALGEAVRRHFESGGDVDSIGKAAKKEFDSIKKGEAKAQYEESKDEIAKRAKDNDAEIKNLAQEMKEGKLDEAETKKRLEKMG